MMHMNDTILRGAARIAVAALCAALLCCGVAGCAVEKPDQQSIVIEEEATPLEERTEEQEAALAEEERAADPVDLGYLPGQIVVVYDSDATEAEREEAVESIGAEEDGQMAEFESGDVSSLTIDEGKTVETAVREAEAEDAVLYAAPNYLVDLLDEESEHTAVPAGAIDSASSADAQGAIAGDNMTAQQWYLDFVHAPQAWQLLADKGVSEPVKVAVLDTGASLTHSDLKNIINRTDSAEVVWTDSTDANSWKAAPLRGDGYTNGGKLIDEQSSHGSHVSGIIAAEAGNGGIVGVASGAGTKVANKLVDLVVIDAFSLLVDDGSGGKKANASLMDLVFAMTYARDKGCKVINMSLGIQTTDTRVSDLFESLCKEMAEKNGILVVSAAGNSGKTDKCYPAACDSVVGVISVSERQNSSSTSTTFLRPAWGTDEDVLRSYFSNYGTWCDISAPGENIYSSVIASGVTNTYKTMQGTSMACPVVAATAAMVMAADPTLSAAEVKDILCSTATDLNTKGKDAQTGYGSLNAEAAVAYALGAVPQTQTVTAAAANLKDAQVSAPTVVYNGAAQTPKVTVKMGSKTLTKGTDYTVSYKTATMKAAGKYTITVTGMGAYTGSKTATFTIQPESVSSGQVTASDQIYTGLALTPSPKVVVKNITLAQGTDYTVTYTSNSAVGTATITIKGVGNYTGTVKGTFTIKAPPVKAATETTPSSSATAAPAPAPAPSTSSSQSAASKSSSTASPGAASGATTTAPVNKATTSTNNPSDTTPVSVAKTNLAAASVSGVGSYYTYTGNAISPTPILRYGGQILRAGVDYTVGYSSNRALGTATVTMTGAGSYKGTLQMRFTIGAPQVNAPKGLKAKAGKKAFTASWKDAVGKVSSYQLQYSTSKKFTKKTTHLVDVADSGKAKLSKSVKKLKGKKTYYVRVRTVYHVGDQTFTSSWTKAVKVKTKR